MSDAWEMIVKVRLQHCMEHSEGEGAMRQVIEWEGGPYQVIIGWADPEDVEIISLIPIPDTAGEQHE